MLVNLLFICVPVVTTGVAYMISIFIEKMERRKYRLRKGR